MIQKREIVERNILICIDILIIIISYIGAYSLRLFLVNHYTLDIIPDIVIMDRTMDFRHIIDYLWLVVPVWIFMFYFQGLYVNFRTKGMLDYLWCLFKADIYAVFIFWGLLYVLKIEYLSRLFIICFMVLVVFMVLVSRSVLIAFLRHARKRGHGFTNILIVGSGDRAKEFVRNVSKRQDWGLRVIGILDYDTSRVGNEISGVKVSGLLSDIGSFITRHVVNEVVFVVPRTKIAEMEPYIMRCELEGIKTSLAVDLYNLKLARSHVTEFEGIPLLTFETTPALEWALFIKRAFDFISSFAALAVLFPLLCAAAVLIKLTSRGPVLYKQRRTGLNGKWFTLYKFRTMVTGADKMQKKLAQQNEMDGPVFKMTNDPRVTPLGRFLRRTSIDELPQLWNVFKGDMSVVGPRPPIPAEVEKYEIWQRRRLSMRPGLTCFWQIQGRNKITDFDTWMKMDLEYIDNWSLKLDFIIILKTIPVVLFGIGAK